MVTPSDAERIALAQSEGQIMLVLRNPLDNETVATTGVKTAALLGPEDSAGPGAAARAKGRRAAEARRAAAVQEAAPAAARAPHRRGHPGGEAHRRGD